MRKKLLFLIFGLLLITGCSKQQKYAVNTIYYDLHISNYYKENIIFTFPSNAYELAEENQNVEYDSLEYILLMDNFSRPIHNNLYTLYGKSIMRLQDAIEVDLNFDYVESDFVNSNYMNTCFEKHSIVDQDDYLEISLSGRFYCLQDKVMTIHVDSDYSNEVTNGTKVGNAFEWVIDSNNVKNVNVYYKVFRDKSQMATSYGRIHQSKKNTDTIAIIEFIVIMIIIFGGFFFYKFLYQKQEHAGGYGEEIRRSPKRKTKTKRKR